MRTSLPAVLLPIAVAAGCIVAIGDGGSNGSLVDDHFAATSTHGTRCSEIAVAAGVDFSAERSDALESIAARGDMTEHEQLFLLDALVAGDGFSGDDTDVLVTLAHNPALADATRNAIAMRIDELDLFSSDRARVAKALSESPAMP